MQVITTPSDLGSIIKAERKRQGLTQVEFAGLCGVGITFLSQLENGKETAELGKTLAVLTTLGLDVFVERRG
ncbi:type II toxin-antitoxin system Y4mF family antitoxin [Enorma phocaeensis]|uniref:Type II toxin-antitoxin system Y4mF family antitoxin n=1 Tax=Enorma phocaeensis TaxID=1871019 RepID=A0A921IVZ1_9ACTN|nr:type II toxin-antitoxin system Y4mF family antitoxin [Enorma phocaeensis]HJG37825.1 type II toxin-antitoxin system Y4mF family antitoxin [Enorma phocaeensis]